MTIEYTWHNKPKHPTFDEMWKTHKGLVFYMAKKLARGFGVHYLELIGTLTLWFNYVLYYFDESKGKFPSFFCRRCSVIILKTWMRKESQSWDNYLYKTQSTSEDRDLTERNYAQHEIDFYLYRIPEEDESDVDEIINFFEGLDECWEFMTRHMDRTDKECLTLYFKEEMTLQQIGDKFRFTRERARQRIERAKLHIRHRLKSVAALADLFSDDGQIIE